MKRILANISRHPLVRRVIGVAQRHRLTAALVLAIGASMALVGASLSLYYMAGFYRYDLSRPAYENEREEIIPPRPHPTYDTTSPVTQATITKFFDEFDQRRRDLQAYGDYRDQGLSNKDLLLTQ